MKKILSTALALLLLWSLIGCGKDNTDNNFERVSDTRNLNAYQNTYANITSIDKEGRTVRAGDVQSENNYVGLFYFLWQGYHTKTYNQNYDLTMIMQENSEYLKSDYLEENSNKFHYWGEPLYGYYCSDDPWVITRHVELLTTIGIDYLIYDLTNAVIYYDAINALFEVLQKYNDQGFDVPKVAFYTNSYSANTITNCYNTWYKNGLYSDLWFSFNEKPLIIGVSSDLTQSQKDLYYNFFDFRESQWPYGMDENLESGFPWMDWNYPQTNFNGTMSVSLAQHMGARMSDGAQSNRGRGFDYTKFRNYSSKTNTGSNFDGQWNTVYTNNLDTLKQKINNVFVTGFNEWIAMKLNDGENSFFVDTFSEEYSRDIEMMKGGYEDNYYLQTADYIKRFKYTDAKHYLYNLNAIDINDSTFLGWNNVTSNFKDFSGDALSRYFRDAGSTKMYTDNSNRNDITDVSITHDSSNLYVKVTTKENITAYNGTDKNWMNLLLRTCDTTENTFAGYNYIINRSPEDEGKTSIEQYSKNSWTKTSTADYKIYGNTIVYSITLSSLGLTKDNCYVQFKVADNVTNSDDIMDYYVSGDCAPVGRLSYSYGY
jgi:hypothetical protein